MAAATVFVALATLVIAAQTFVIKRQATEQLGSSDNCFSPIYCRGDLLKTVQLAEIFNDSKTFVDLYQYNDPEITLANFQTLMRETNNNPNRTQIAKYVSENFAQQDELISYDLPDWQENPPILKNIQDVNFRQWAKDLNAIWRTLARKIRPSVKENPQRHSIIYVENGFIIPGGRFKEFYYWDSYWVIEGLLLCNMPQTAKGMIDNFISMVDRFGFIPNGGRVYYLMRSQPPMLIPMVDKYLEATNDQKYLSSIIATLDKEFSFWQNNKTVRVEKNCKTYTLARYSVDSSGPRPESYREDYTLSQKLPEEQRIPFYNDIIAAAESGWDFSHRWYKVSGDGEMSLLNISTSSFIPVELNAILQRNARLMSLFHARLGNVEKSKSYEKVARDYQIAIDEVLWNDEEGAWLDYDINTNQGHKSFYPSNVAPLYTMSYDKSKAPYYARKIVAYLKNNKIDTYYGGTPASLLQTGEQWDYPNAWPPLQSFVVAGLHQTADKQAIQFSEELCDRWLKANYKGYVEYDKMFEKYSAIEPGQAGGGGEYQIQTGFGWTNGVVLGFFELCTKATSGDTAVLIEDNEVDR
ncbi:trehalase-like [Prorops nasuta]|uniref:trehalase-like n=1 Tax=Prorops nasuta TaxID=863751 RepID=UPI0034CE80A9